MLSWFDVWPCVLPAVPKVGCSVTLRLARKRPDMGALSLIVSAFVRQRQRYQTYCKGETRPWYSYDRFFSDHQQWTTETRHIEANSPPPRHTISAKKRNTIGRTQGNGSTPSRATVRFVPQTFATCRMIWNRQSACCETGIGHPGLFRGQVSRGSRPRHRAFTTLEAAGFIAKPWKTDKVADVIHGIFQKHSNTAVTLNGSAAHA